MVEQVSNYFYLVINMQVYKWYADSLVEKTNIFFVSMITVVHNELDINLVDDLFKIPTHTCSCKLAR